MTPPQPQPPFSPKRKAKGKATSPTPPPPQVPEKLTRTSYSAEADMDVDEMLLALGTEGPSQAGRLPDQQRRLGCGGYIGESPAAEETPRAGDADVKAKERRAREIDRAWEVRRQEILSESAARRLENTKVSGGKWGGGEMEGKGGGVVKGGGIGGMGGGEGERSFEAWKRVRDERVEEDFRDMVGKTGGERAELETRATGGKDSKNATGNKENVADGEKKALWIRVQLSKYADPAFPDFLNWTSDGWVCKLFAIPTPRSFLEFTASLRAAVEAELQQMPDVQAKRALAWWEGRRLSGIGMRWNYYHYFHHRGSSNGGSTAVDERNWEGVVEVLRKEGGRHVVALTFEIALEA